MQTCKDTFIESFIQLIGTLVITFTLPILLLYVLGYEIKLTDNLMVSVLITAVNFVKHYFVRRHFTHRDSKLRNK